MTLDFPDELYPDAESWGITYSTQGFSSDLNGVEQTKELPGAKWKCTRTYTQREGLEARKLQAFVSSLRGTSGRFWVVPGDWHPLGTAMGSPEVSSPVLRGVTSLPTTGWDINQVNALEIGDWFEVNGELKKTTSVVESDGSGDATIEFAPPLRIGVGSGTQVRITEPRCRMKIKADDNQWNLSSPIIYAMDFDMVEALD